VALRGEEVWKLDVARRSCEGWDREARSCEVCGLATSRARGRTGAAIWYGNGDGEGGIGRQLMVLRGGSIILSSVSEFG
jgi:hypothetical protein